MISNIIITDNKNVSSSVLATLADDWNGSKIDLLHNNVLRMEGKRYYLNIKVRKNALWQITIKLIKRQGTTPVFFFKNILTQGQQYDIV